MFKLKPHNLFFPLFLLGALVLASHGRIQAAPSAPQAPKWSYALPGLAGTNSPALEDINNDGNLDVIVGTANGHVVAVNHAGALLWDTDLGPLFGQGANSLRISAAPAVADIDNDGQMEVVAATGWVTTDVCHIGGVIVLNHLGQKESGNWPLIAQDNPDLPPSNCPASIYSTPGLGDVDGDGDMELFFGGFDRRIYGLHHNGTAVTGFPADSYLRGRFPTWPNLIGHLSDTVWSSPALADLDGDGLPEIYLGTDEGNMGNSFGGNTMNWYCPYATPWGYEYCGGTLYGLSATGTILPGFPKLFWEHIQSTPAIADLNGDGTLDITIGTGTFYATVTGMDKGRRFLAYDGATGGFLAGWNSYANVWEGGQNTTSGTPSPPAIGDITGDGQLDVVAFTFDNKVYAWHGNGTAVAGFPLTPSASFFQFGVGQGPVLADYNGDGDMEIFFTANTSVVVLDGNGTQLVAQNDRFWLESFFPNGFRVSNTPAVGDLDGNGKLDLVVSSGMTGLDSGGGYIVAWELANSSTAADWPMFKRNAARTSTLIPPTLRVQNSILSALHTLGDNSDIVKSITLANTGEDDLNWSISGLPGRITAVPQNGTLGAGEQTAVQITIDTNGLPLGSNPLGSFNVAATTTGGGQTAAVLPPTVSTTVIIANQIYTAYLPLVTR